MNLFKTITFSSRHKIYTVNMNDSKIDSILISIIKKTNKEVQALHAGGGVKEPDIVF